MGLKTRIENFIEIGNSIRFENIHIELLKAAFPFKRIINQRRLEMVSDPIVNRAAAEAVVVFGLV